MFVTTRVVGRQPYAPAAFTPEEIPGTLFQRRPQVADGGTACSMEGSCEYIE